MSEFKIYLKKLINKENLSIDESFSAVRIMLLGGSNPSQIAAFIMAMSIKK